MVQLPEIVVAAVVVEVALQVWPRILAVHTTPPCGMVSVDVPPEDTHKPSYRLCCLQCRWRQN